MLSLCMAFGVVALNIALYLHNLATPTRADRQLTSLSEVQKPYLPLFPFILSHLQ